MRLTKFNPETGQYEYIEPAKTQEQFIAQRKAVIQKLGEYEDECCKEGYNQGVKDFAERVKNYYRHTTSRPLPATVEYYIDRLEKEMTKDEGNKKDL